MNDIAKKIRNWLLEKFESSNITLLNKISNSLKRDHDVPFSFLVRKAIIYFYSKVTARFNLRRCDEVGQRPRTRHRPFIKNMGKIVIGSDVNINSRNVQTDLVTGPDGLLEIGDKTSINFGVSLVANEKISIGKRVRVGPYTMIYDSNMHVQGKRYVRAPGDPVTIGDDAWLASRVMVMKGSKIGKGSVIAAGSVVSGIIPPYVVAAGVPARIVKYMQPSEESCFMWEGRRNGESIDPDILARVSKVAANSFAMEPSAIDADQSHNTIENWDAFRHVKFIRSLENQFHVEISDKDWSRITTIKRAAKVIEKNLKEKYVLS